MFPISMCATHFEAKHCNAFTLCAIVFHGHTPNRVAIVCHVLFDWNRLVERGVKPLMYELIWFGESKHKNKGCQILLQNIYQGSKFFVYAELPCIIASRRSSMSVSFNVKLGSSTNSRNTSRTALHTTVSFLLKLKGSVKISVVLYKKRP